PAVLPGQPVQPGLQRGAAVLAVEPVRPGLRPVRSVRRGVRRGIPVLRGRRRLPAGRLLTALPGLIAMTENAKAKSTETQGTETGKDKPRHNRNMQIVVKVSKFCNLRCEYCYEYPELGNRAAMSREQLAAMYRSLGDYLRERD